VHFAEAREIFPVRITGGELAGRKIDVPRREEVRPTADRVRESLFARLGPLPGGRVLDLFAGSGALGIEALSRGAAEAVFVDRAAGCAARIRANLEALGLAERAQVLRSPVRSALPRLAAWDRPFDLVLLDPPYATDEASRVLPLLASPRLVNPGAVLVLETHRRHDPGPVEGLRRIDERRYGDTLIARYQTEGAP
jgi:16S rRNA (guanine966-N2)-methyltransferase